MNQITSRDAPAASAGDHPRAGRDPATRRTVLVVDDELALARSYARALGAEGYEVLTATDGDAAEAVFREHHVDAVVSDIGMPGMDGIALLRAVHGIDPTVPFVVATGNAEDGLAREAVREGALMYLVKPVDLRTLAQIIAHATQPRALPAPTRPPPAAVPAVPVGPAVPAPAAADGLAACLDAAIERLWIAYQPIVYWATCATVAYEALVRSDEPTLATPAPLLAAAETLGRSVELGRAIRARVAADLGSAPVGVKIFVNVGKEELGDPQLCSPEDPLHAHAGRVVLEITERASFDAETCLVARAAALRAAGFQVAIDDLGAGYAGLTSIALLGPSVVKLDASLIRHIDESAGQRRIVQAVLQLCRDLSIDVIAEGVETEAERLALGFLGCQHHQGFAYARPQRGFGGGPAR